MKLGENNAIIASSWKGWTYGIRLLEEGRELFLSIVGDCTSVIIELEDTGERDIVNVTQSFRSGCPELRGKIFKKYFERKGIIQWEKGKPYKLKLTYIGRSKNNGLPIFRIKLLS